MGSDPALGIVLILTSVLIFLIEYVSFSCSLENCDNSFCLLSFTFQTSAKDSSIFTIVLHRVLRGKTLGKRWRAFLSMFLDDSDMHPVHFSLFCLRFEESFELGKNGTNGRWHISVNRTIVCLVTLYYSSNDYSYKGTSRIQAVDNQHVWYVIYDTTNILQ